MAMKMFSCEKTLNFIKAIPNPNKKAKASSIPFTITGLKSDPIKDVDGEWERNKHPSMHKFGCKRVKAVTMRRYGTKNVALSSHSAIVSSPFDGAREQAKTLNFKSSKVSTMLSYALRKTFPLCYHFTIFSSLSLSHLSPLLGNVLGDGLELWRKKKGSSTFLCVNNWNGCKL